MRNLTVPGHSNAPLYAEIVTSSNRPSPLPRRHQQKIPEGPSGRAHTTYLHPAASSRENQNAQNTLKAPIPNPRGHPTIPLGRLHTFVHPSPPRSFREVSVPMQLQNTKQQYERRGFCLPSLHNTHFPLPPFHPILKQLPSFSSLFLIAKPQSTKDYLADGKCAVASPSGCYTSLLPLHPSLPPKNRAQGSGCFSLRL